MKTSTILTAIFAISIWACNPAGNASNEDSIVTGNNTGTLNEPTVSDTSSTNSDLAYLLDYNSRYPHEVNLWMNEILQKRLDLIIGKESLDMIKQWTTEVPIEVSDGFVKISVC